MSKNIVIVGKGPSTRFIPKSNDYKIACFNNATIQCEEIDYFFQHDQDNMNLIDTEEFKKIKNFIMPYFPQKSNPGGFSSDYGPDVWMDPVLEVNPKCKFHLVALGVHDLNGLKYPEGIPHMGETYSVLQTAATWLGMFDKVDNLITCGLDPEGGYHPKFQTMKKDDNGKIIPTTNGNSVWDEKAAKETHRRFHDIARRYNYSIHRMTDDGGMEQIV